MDVPLDYTSPAAVNAPQVYAYQLYLPPGYTPGSGSWPLLLQVHGINHEGNGTTELYKVGQRGAMEHLHAGRREDLFRRAIIVAPQKATTMAARGYPLGSPTLRDFIVYLKATYRIDPNRVLLTGWSGGGQACWELVNFLNFTEGGSNRMVNQVAAYAAVCGGYLANASDFGPHPARLQKLPIWNFHNQDDTDVRVRNSELWLNGIATALHLTDFPAATSYASNVLGNYPGAATYTASYTSNTGWTWRAGRAQPSGATYPWFTLAPTGGHNAWSAAYAVDSALWPWIFAQANTAPTISALSNRMLAVGQSTGPMAFTINDPQTASTQLLLSVASSNVALVRTTDVTFGGSGAARTLMAVPRTGVTGASTITVTVLDGLLTDTSSFVLTTGTPVAGDATGDGQVTAADLDAVKAVFGKRATDPSWNAQADLNHDNRIDHADLDIVVRALGG